MLFRSVAVRGMLVAISVSVIVAPDTTAFDGSATEPETVPDEADSDHTGKAPPKQTNKRRTRTDFTLRMAFSAWQMYSPVSGSALGEGKAITSIKRHFRS